MAQEIFLAGPTGVGKSSVALRLAQALPGEIVSVDSMQVYRGLDIGTAKPSAKEMAEVPHHLVSIVGLEEEFDAAQFVLRARAAVVDILARGGTPILCGGTGLYFRAYTDGVGEAPPADMRLRLELEKSSPAELLEELKQKDPAAWAWIDRKNPRRLIRAVEVIRLTGRPFSEQRSTWNPPAGKLAGRTFMLERAAEDLRARIEGRVEEMFRGGLVEETRRLLGEGLEKNRTALQALGYRQVVDFLGGEGTLAATMARVKARSWQYAKRQMTWFRKYLSGERLQVSPNTTPEQVARDILERLPKD